VNLHWGAPAIVETTVWSALPDRFREPRDNEWARANRRGAVLDSFLEGPAFDAHGHLYVTDIPYGRIFRISPARQWALVARYEGWPNGLKVMADGTLLVTDYRLGLVRADPATGEVRPLLPRRNSESFKGLNDLCVAPDGTVYFTDQGQTGMHDPSGRVFRLEPGGRLDCLLDNVPSPNGIVLDAAGQVLFVAATRGNEVWRVPLADEGGVAKAGVFCRLFGTGGPDGLALDAAGRLYVAHVSLGHVFVYSPRGELTHAIRSCAGAATTNLALSADATQAWITESESGSVLHASLPWAAA
jgi:gluconolactonase